MSQPPKFDVPLEPATVTEGGILSLKCHVIGSPPMTIQWMKDRRELKSSGHTKITFIGGTACLEVGVVSKTDAGDYLCKASSAAGTDFCKSKVTVKGKGMRFLCLTLTFCWAWLKYFTVMTLSISCGTGSLYFHLHFWTWFWGNSFSCNKLGLFLIKHRHFTMEKSFSQRKSLLLVWLQLPGRNSINIY